MGRYPWAVRAGGPLLGGGGGGVLPGVFFDWNPQVAQVLPVTSTFTRASAAAVLTRSTTEWFQKARVGEPKFIGLRRVDQLVDVPLSGFALVGGATFSDPQLDLDVSAQSRMGRIIDTGELVNGATFCVSARVRRVGGSDVDFTLRCSHPGVGEFVSNDLTATSTYQIFSFTQQFTNAGATNTIDVGVQNEAAGGSKSVDVDWIQAEKVQSTSDTFGGLVEFGVTYNAEVANVRVFNTLNGNTVSGAGVVTEGTGATINGGGWLWEPAATNLYPDSRLTAVATWTNDNCTLSGDGVNSLGLQQQTVTANSSTSVHRIKDDATLAQYFPGSSYILAKKGTYRYVEIVRGGQADDFAVFDFDTASVTQLGAGADSARMLPLSDGWFKCEISVSRATNIAFGAAVVIPPNGTPGTTAPSWTPVGTESVLVCHAQYEDTSYATSPIPTSGGVVTRVADSLSDVAWTDPASSVIDTTVAPFIPGGVIADQQNMLGFGENTVYAFQVDAPAVARIRTGGINSPIGATSSYELERHGFGMSIQINEGIVVDDENNDNTDVTGTPGGGTIQIGSNSTLVGVPGIYHRIRIANVPQTVAELKALV